MEPLPQIDNLYILRAYPVDPLVPLLPADNGRHPYSLVLIHDAVAATQLPPVPVYVLAPDLETSGKTSPFRTISYEEFSRIVVSASRVVVL